MDFLDEARVWTEKLPADPRHHNAIPCVCRHCNSLEAAALDSYHLLVRKLQATLPLKEPKLTIHPCIAWDITYIDEHLDERLALNEPAAKDGLSMWSFCAVFRQHAGASPRCYIWGQRLQKKQSLLTGSESRASAALLAGLYDQSHPRQRGAGLAGIAQHRADRNYTNAIVCCRRR